MSLKGEGQKCDHPPASDYPLQQNHLIRAKGISVAERSPPPVRFTTAVEEPNRVRAVSGPVGILNMLDRNHPNGAFDVGFRLQNASRLSWIS